MPDIFKQNTGTILWTFPILITLACYNEGIIGFEGAAVMLLAIIALLLLLTYDKLGRGNSE